MFDLNQGLLHLKLDPDKLIASFHNYLSLQGHTISRSVAEQRMLEKLQKSLTKDVAPLLSTGANFTDDDAIAAFNRVWLELITRISGEPWKLSEQIVEKLRKEKIPKLLQ